MSNNENDTFESGVNEEQELAQLNSIISNQNAIDKVQQALAKQRSQPSLSECEDCGEDIPKPRQVAQPGVTRCIFCQELEERRQKGF
jgi:phage/conjugal plasmid C-4 type zinc finger TraR family protein